MEKCQHNSKILYFCIYDHCSAKQPGGCQGCMRKYHSHVGNSGFIKLQEVELISQKFNVQNSIKPKCRSLQQYVFNFFTLIKNQIAQTIDIVCKGMMNRIGYPYLSNLGHLPSYKRIKSKQFKKISGKQLKKFYFESKGLQKSAISRKQKDYYTQQIIENFATIESLQSIMKSYENSIKKLYKNYRHDSSAFKKIQDLKKYLQHLLSSQKQLNNKQRGLNNERLILNSKKQKVEDLPETSSQSKKQNKVFQEQISKKKNINQNQKNEQYVLDTQFKNVKNGQVRHKYKHMRNISVQSEGKNSNVNEKIQININGFENVQIYESKEKQIYQRKEKLIQMMSFKQKNANKVLQSTLKTPPLLLFQKNPIEISKSKSNEIDQNKNMFDSNKIDSELIDSTQNFLQVPSSKKCNLNNKLLNSPRSQNRPMSLSNSVKSFQQSLNEEVSDIKNDQNQNENRYKYVVCRLPSSDSNSQSNQTFSNIGTTQKTSMKQLSNKNSLNNSSYDLTFSTPLKKQLQRKSQNNAQQMSKQQEQSTCLYYKALRVKSSDAIQYLKTALKYSNKNLSAAQYLSFLYLKQNKVKECLDLCNEYLNILGICKDYDLKQHFLNNKAASLNILGRYSQAVMLLQAEVLKYDSSKMYKNLADSYLSIGINEKCQYNYQKAIRMDQKFDEAMYNLSVCLYSQGNYHNASIWIKKALQTKPNIEEYLILNNEINKKFEKMKQDNVIEQ